MITRLSLALMVSFCCFMMMNTGVHAAELVAACSFDDEGSDIVKDVTGNGHDGVIVDAKYVDGKMGTALEFNGTSSEVLVDHAEDLNIQDEITIAAWINPTIFARSSVAQKWGDKSNRRQYQLMIEGSGKTRWWVSGPGTTWPSLTGNTAPVIGEWAHIAATYDGAKMKVYFNGVLDGESSMAEGIFASDIHFVIGGYGPDDETGGNRHFGGIIDEVRLWHGILEEAEITEAMDEAVVDVAQVAPNGKMATLWGALRSR